MIEVILELLSSEDFLAQSELIDIAKGKYQFTTTLADKKKQYIRSEAWQLKKQ